MTVFHDKTTNDFGHGGNLADLAARVGCPPERIIDFSASLNPLGPPEYLRQVICRNLAGLSSYPDPRGEALLNRLAETLGVEERQLVAGNGSTELIYGLPRALPCGRAVIPVPSYIDYERAARLAGLEVRCLHLSEEDGFRLDCAGLAENIRPGDLVFLGRPNNPTGIGFAGRDLLGLVNACPGTFFAVDESFLEFCVPSSELVDRSMPANLIVLRSLTKFYAIPGLRLGFAVSAPATTALLRRQVPPWSVNGLALAAGCRIVADREYGERTRQTLRGLRHQLREDLERIAGLKVFTGEANFLLVKITTPGFSARRLADNLLRQSHDHPLAIRVCDNYEGLDHRFFRVAVRTGEENGTLCRALARELSHTFTSGPERQKKTPALMLQGTSSNAGKSVLTAALGRIFLQDGFRVAPFKAQNMSLNSFVTRNGRELGRAQVVQAQACRLDADVRMNPVLLKPTGEAGSQVIVNGRPVGNMSVEEYIRYKPEARRAVFSAYDALAKENDVLLLEGAGSPAEVNLRRHDIVNMAMASYAEAPVLLVGDIDRGGVFASFVGTMEVMAEWERQLVAGFVVNRFRGQASLLDDAFEYVENFTGKPVLGVIPHIHDLGLPEEDSVGFKAGLFDRKPPAGDFVGIGLIDLPHISNFTDVEPLLAEPDVHLRIIRGAGDLAEAEPDLAAIILPGSKNVGSDLAFLERSGLGGRISRLAAEGSLRIVGICGGFQMLGREIHDPLMVESGGGNRKGLGILDMTTALAADKVLARQNGVHLPSMLNVYGYEIHHGRTSTSHRGILRMQDGSEAGAVSANGLVWGSYLHGIFDDDLFRRWFIDGLRTARGMVPLGRVVARYDLEPAIDRLAAIVREALDIPRLYRLMGLK